MPSEEVTTRLVLLALALALQNALEMPREGVTALLGTRLTSLLVIAALAASLMLVWCALRPNVPRWHWLRLRWVRVLLVVATCGAALIGLKQVGSMAASGFFPPYYPNDGTTLDHYAAQQLLEGHNPYVTTNIVAAIRFLGQNPVYTTPLHVGAFAHLGLTHAPSGTLMQRTFYGGPASLVVREFESHVSYPSLAVLVLVPWVWAGSPSVVPFFALCLLALGTLVVLYVPAEARLWMALLLVADAPLLDAGVAGDLDLLYLLLVFVAWLFWRRRLTSMLALGLACAAKQIAWFYVPFYVILVWRREGARSALTRLAGAGVVFLAINAPFMVANWHAWLTGVLAPVVDPMFPEGNGLIRLALSGWLPLMPTGVYTALELVGFAMGLVWYWRHVEEMPEAGFLLAVAPLFFAWRSLTTYFYFVAVPAVALLLARRMKRTGSWAIWRGSATEPQHVAEASTSVIASSD